ncbi:MAG: hypothetical protein H0V51_07425 [Chloroflexi bacterium]|nr:hypothetical protein [Chloroflexota bacterium]
MTAELLLAAGLVLLLDQASKQLVLERLGERQLYPGGWKPRIRRVANPSLNPRLARGRRPLRLLTGARREVATGRVDRCAQS